MKFILIIYIVSGNGNGISGWDQSIDLQKFETLANCEFIKDNIKIISDGWTSGDKPIKFDHSSKCLKLPDIEKSIIKNIEGVEEVEGVIALPGFSIPIRSNKRWNDD